MDQNMKFADYKIVIWGHKLHSHTHSYIHNAFYLAFMHLKYKTYWFDNNDDVSSFDFSKSIFITEGQVDGNIPVRDDCLYVLHNCYDPKYQQLFQKNRCMMLQTYTDNALKDNVVKVEECIYHNVAGRCLYMPWATDLLPYQIERNKNHALKRLPPFNKNCKVINWVGTIGAGKFGNINQIDPFKKAAAQNGIIFTQAGGRGLAETVQLIRNSYMAPTIVGEWQHEVGYVPCRIFKNISYGQFGITNSPRVHQLFDQRLVYNDDTRQLFYDGQTRLESLKLDELHALMDFVKDKHTYINRINTIFDFMEKVS
jgi:hypothetical protein